MHPTSCRLVWWLALLGATWLWPDATRAQTSLRLTVTESLERVDHDGPTPDPKHAPAVTATIEHLAFDQRLRVFSDVDVGTYVTEGDWRYFAFAAGGSQRFDLGASHRRLFIGGQADFRVNGDAWTDANYRGISAFANLEIRPAPTSALRAGYRFTGRTFPDLGTLDQQEHAIFGSALVNLQSRTTLIGEVTTGVKSYDSVDETVVVGGSPTQTMTGTQVGRGPGVGQNTGTARFSPAPTHVLTSVRGDQAKLVQVFGRVAQSLADRLSLSGEATVRWAFDGAPPTLVSTPEVLFDDPVYDDPYASDGWSLRAGLKRVFASGATVEGGVWRVAKDYTAALALDADGLPGADLALRSDRAWRGSIDLSLPIASQRLGPVSLNWWTGYRLTNSRSNDAFYTYTSHRVGTGLTLRY
ncbi:MAG: hypothetical protein KJ066_09380 [Acidobacteria bacterium]|nr:hypothetical protein [Acidobacteriota bacterium]